MQYKTAAINIEPILFHKEENIRKEIALVTEAAENGAKLIALPEMATTGYCFYSREEIAPFVEPIPGQTTSRFEKIAIKYNCYIAFGMPEVDADTDIYYNSAVLIGPEGIIGVHRKTHSYISEAKWASQGNLGHKVYDTAIGKIGMLICMDMDFMEPARIEGLEGADVIIHLSAWPDEKTPAPYWSTRAYENGCYVLDSNRIGLERTVMFSGGSCLINPDGTIQSYVDSEETICFGIVDLLRARKNKFENCLSIFLDRKPLEYQELLLNPYLWSPIDFFSLYGMDSLPTGRKSKIGVAQINPYKCDTAKNTGIIKKYMEQANSNGTELIVFPELSITGRPENIDEAKNIAVTVGDSVLDDILDEALKSRVYVVVGAVEEDAGHYYNSVFLIGPDGIEAVYRKIHLTKEDEKWAEEGNLGFVYANIPIGRIGLLTGTDSLFPESCRILALMGADLITCSADESGPRPFALKKTNVKHRYPIAKGYFNVHWHLWRIRAGENNTYLAFANTVHGKSMGRSGIFGPNAYLYPRDEIILSENEESLVSLEIDTSNPYSFVRRKDSLAMRQPQEYDILVRKF